MKTFLRLGPALCALGMSALPACSSDPEDPGVGSGAGGAFTGVGGTPAAGGVAGTGGVPGAGGALPPGSGGITGTGGAASTGGAFGAGGISGSGGASGAGGMSGTGGGPPAEPPECITKSSQVILMGDSYITWVSHNFPADLNAEAGQTFRNYAIGAWSMGSGGVDFIPKQLDTALAADPDIKVIILDGGGNDVLVPDQVQFPQSASCKNDINSPSIPDCQAIVQKAIDTAVSLMDRVVDVGVTDVLYFFYPHVPEGTLIGGAHPNAILDYALPKVKAACDGAEAATQGKLRCHFVDLIPVFEGHPEYFAPTDIHPSIAGGQAMAKAIWQRMKDECIGQMESSGCCEPP